MCPSCSLGDCPASSQAPALPCDRGGNSTRDGTKPEWLNGTTGTTRTQPAARMPAGFALPIRSRRLAETTTRTPQAHRWCTVHRAGSRTQARRWCTVHRAGDTPRAHRWCTVHRAKGATANSAVVHGAPRRESDPGLAVVHGAPRREHDAESLVVHGAPRKNPRKIADGERCTAPIAIPCAQHVVHGAPSGPER